MSEMDIYEVLKNLPQRYPVLMIDRVKECEPGKRIVALKNVSANEPHFQGHFPGRPIMPGVLIVEAMAQAGGILLLHELPPEQRRLLYFTAIERARFRRPIVPGDQVRLEVEVLRLRESFVRTAGKAFVDGKLAAEATLSSAMVERG